VSKPKRLGQGLAALLGTPLEEEAVSVSNPATYSAIDSAADPTDRLLQLNVYEIDDNPFQPRREFSEPEIMSLSESLKTHDMLQPILVRKVGDRFQLISGERRLRAAIQAGWSQVPARLREADDRLVAELAIVENLQRKDLNPIEKAMSFRRYLEEHECTQEDLAQRIKINRTTIANLIRLLDLPAPILVSIQQGSLSAGHARALLPLGDERAQLDFAERIRTEGISVRETERQVSEKIVAEDSENWEDTKKRKKPRTKNDQVASLEQQLRMALGTKVEINTTSRGRGKIVIQFQNLDEFERIRTLLIDSGGAEVNRRAG
jgi:ParB family chromosome partitioning protein